MAQTRRKQEAPAQQASIGVGAGQPDPQIQNALSLEVQATRALFDAIFSLKKSRAYLEALGVPSLDDETLDASTTGELSHLNPIRLKMLLAAMDVLDAALVTPTDLAGITAPPIAALVAVIR